MAARWLAALLCSAEELHTKQEDYCSGEDGRQQPFGGRQKAAAGSDTMLQINISEKEIQMVQADLCDVEAISDMQMRADCEDHKNGG